MGRRGLEGMEGGVRKENSVAKTLVLQRYTANAQLL